jgi:hypothetical protein
MLQGSTSNAPSFPTQAPKPQVTPQDFKAAQEALKPVQDKHWPTSYAAGYRMAPRNASLNSTWKPSPSQTTSLKRYTTSTGYAQINNQLRFGQGTNQTQHIKAIDAAFADVAPLTTSLVLSRKLSGNGPFPGYPPPMTAGAVFRDKGYVSTSKDPNVFGGDVLMEVRVPKGKKVIDLNHTSGSAFEHEHEVLLPRNTQFKIVSDSMASNGKRKIIVEVV